MDGSNYLALTNKRNENGTSVETSELNNNELDDDDNDDNLIDDDEEDVSDDDGSDVVNDNGNNKNDLYNGVDEYYQSSLYGMTVIMI